MNRTIGFRRLIPGNQNCRRWLTFGIIALSTPVWAMLGGDANSVDTDRAGFARSTYQVWIRGSSRVHEIGSTSLRIREYTGAAGQVFAVSWTGKVHPDLQSLLGSYFSDFQEALKAASSGVRTRRVPYRLIKGSQVTVELSGHFGSVSGRAYVESLIPTEVNLNDIR